VFIFSKDRNYTLEKTLLELPEKPKLAEHKSVTQKKQIVHRQNQNPVGNAGRQRDTACWKQVFEQRALQKKNGKAGAGKHDQNHYYLKGAGNIPPLL
jgi:hypothetical protein